MSQFDLAQNQGRKLGQDAAITNGSGNGGGYAFLVWNVRSGFMVSRVSLWLHGPLHGCHGHFDDGYDGYGTISRQIARERSGYSQ